MVFDADPDGVSISVGVVEDTLSVVIVDHRRRDLLGTALEALRASRRAPDEIIVVDVDPVSPLPSAAVNGAVPTRVVTLAENPGYAAACNRGAAQAQGRWVLFMNADVTVADDAIEAVLDEASADPAIGIATCRLVRPDGSMDHACHRGIPSVLDSLLYKARLDRLAPRSRRLGHYRLTWLDERDTHDIESCSGAFMLVRRAALDAIDGWDERYWFYGEDLDLCLRMTKAGWRVRYVGSHSAVHVKGASSHLWRSPRELTPPQRATRQRVREASVESHQRFYREHLEAGTARPLRPLVNAMFSAQRRITKRR